MAKAALKNKQKREEISPEKREGKRGDLTYF